MQSSSRRLRRSVPRGGRLALVVPTALLAITAMVTPSFADDVTSEDGGETPTVVETPKADPAPEPKSEPKPEPKPEPAEVKPEPKPEPAEPKVEEKAEEKAAEAPAIQAIPEDTVPAGTDAEQGAQAITADAAVLAAQETCKDDDGWTKIDGLSSLTETITAPIGKVIVEVCAKSSTNVAYHDLGDGVAEYTIVSGTGPWSGFVNKQGKAQDLSHASYLLADAPDPEPSEIDAPDLTVNDPCGPDNAVYGEVPEGPYDVVINDDGSITLTALGDATFAGGEPTHTYPAPVDSGVICTDGEDGKKVVVCKYVSTPGGELDHIIIVSVATLFTKDPPWDGVTFPYQFPDAQDSVAIRFAEEGEQAKDVLDAECIDDEEPAEIDAPELDVLDPCGVGNAEYGEVPFSEDYSIAYNDDGSITLTALGETTFAGGEPTYTYPVPVETNTEECPEVDDTRVVLCTYPLVARATTLLGTIVIADLADVVAEGFAGVFPFEFVNDGVYSEAIRYAFEGETAEDIDAVVCGVDSEIDEVPGEVGGTVETAALPNTGGPAGLLVPLGAGLMMAGAALVMARRPRTA